MLQRFDSRPDDNVNEARFFFQTIKRPDTDYQQLMVNIPALLFMGDG
jgi:hypothetical protein